MPDTKNTQTTNQNEFEINKPEHKDQDITTNGNKNTKQENGKDQSAKWQKDKINEGFNEDGKKVMKK